MLLPFVSFWSWKSYHTRLIEVSFDVVNCSSLFRFQEMMERMQRCCKKDEKETSGIPLSLPWESRRPNVLMSFLFLRLLFLWEKSWWSWQWLSSCKCIHASLVYFFSFISFSFWVMVSVFMKERFFLSHNVFSYRIYERITESKKQSLFAIFTLDLLCVMSSWIRRTLRKGGHIPFQWKDSKNLILLPSCYWTVFLESIHDCSGCSTCSFLECFIVSFVFRHALFLVNTFYFKNAFSFDSQEIFALLLCSFRWL